MTELQRIRDQATNEGCDQCAGLQLVLDALDAFFGEMTIEEHIESYTAQALWLDSTHREEEAVKYHRVVEKLEALL